MNTTTYAIRVEGHLDDHWAARLGALDLTRVDDGTTTIRVAVADQAQLHGVLAGLRDIGVVLTGLAAEEGRSQERHQLWPAAPAPTHPDQGAARRPRTTRSPR